MSIDNTKSSDSVRFGTRCVGSIGWKSLWRGVIVTPGENGGIVEESVGGDHLEVKDALDQARAVHAARQPQEQIAMAA